MTQIISKANIIKLTNILSAAFRGKFKREKANELKFLSKRFGTYNNMSFQIKHSDEQI